MTPAPPRQRSLCLTTPARSLCLSLAFDRGAGGVGPGAGMVVGAHGDYGHYVTLEDGRVVFITGGAGVVPPRLAADAGASKRFTRAGLQRAILEHHRAMNGGEDDFTSGMERELTEAAGSASDAFRFYRKLPTEIKDAIADHPALRRVFTVTDDPRAAHGADAYGTLGDRYIEIARAKAGSPLNAAMETARTSQDPEMRLLAHVHDHLPEDGASLKAKATRLQASAPKNLERAGRLEEQAKTATAADAARLRRQATRLRRDAADAPGRAAEHERAAANATRREAVNAAGLRVGDRFHVNGQEFRVAEHQDEEGNRYRILRGSDLQPVPVDAVSHLPIDRGTFKPGRLRKATVTTYDDGIPFGREQA